MALHRSRASVHHSAADWIHSYVGRNVLLQYCHRRAEDQRFLGSRHRVSRYA